MLENDIGPYRSLSPLTITALAEVIAGEARSKNGTSLGGRTRSVREIERFMMGFGVDFSQPWSRVNDLRNCLQELSRETIRKVILGAFDSYSFEKRYVSEESLVYFNRFLKEDGYEVVISNDVPEIHSLNKVVPEAQLSTQRERRLRSAYRKEFGPDFGWFISILLLILLSPFWLLKVLFKFIIKILSQIITKALGFLITAAAILIVLGILVFIVQPSIPAAMLEDLLNSPMLKLVP